MKTKTKALQVDGSLLPDAWYNVDGLKARGVGDHMLRNARRLGVRPHRIGRMAWYRGADLINWIIQASEAKSLSETEH